MLCVVLQLIRDLGKPKADGNNPFILFVKSKTVERGDAPLVVTILLHAVICRCHVSKCNIVQVMHGSECDIPI